MDKVSTKYSETINVIPVVPSTNLLSVLAQAGYSLPSAIADLLDNSIFKGAHNITIDFERKGEESEVIISDDGLGMDRDGLIEALTLAPHSMEEERDFNDLGRFGVGMKTASFSFCKTLRVESKVEGKTPNAFESYKNNKY